MFNELSQIRQLLSAVLGSEISCKFNGIESGKIPYFFLEKRAFFSNLYVLIAINPKA